MPIKPVGALDYPTLRRVVGALGVALPLIVTVWGCLLLGRFEVLPSISDYYSLRTRDAFVGILFTIAWFLYAYSPYKGDPDDVAGNWACAFALGVAIFPNSGTGWDPVLHFTSAFGLFSVLAYFSLCLFTKSGPVQTKNKGWRNLIYRVCGWTIVGCIALIGLYYWLLRDTALADWKPVLCLESIALWAFGISWGVKGDTILKDPKTTDAPPT